MHKHLASALGFLFLTACGSTVSSPSDAHTQSIRKAPGAAELVNSANRMERIDSIADIKRVARGDAEYERFLVESWKKFEEVAPVAELRQQWAAQGNVSTQNVGYCYVSAGTFSNIPISNTVTGTYDSGCSAGGNATIVYGNHTLQVNNTSSGQMNGTSRTSTNGTISFAGAPVTMSYGGHMYCARGYHAVRTADGNTFSKDTYWNCDYYFS